jgi:alpha-N-arabinofuranosidase
MANIAQMINNFNPTTAASLTCTVTGASPKTVIAKVLTAPTITAQNTFDNPTTVKPKAFTTIRMGNGGFTATLAREPVVAIELK